ncbi:MAG: FliH/SctL family protein [Vulcanimicrobiaceae bacterium]
MPDGFVPLAALLDRSLQSRADRRAAATIAERPAEPPAESLTGQVSALDDPRVRPLLAQIVAARLAIAESYERRRDQLFARLAREVLGRELALAPCSLEPLAREVWESARDCEPIVVHLAPSDAARFELDLPVCSDPALEPGDLVLAVRDGSIDARFGVRARELLDGRLP